MFAIYFVAASVLGIGSIAALSAATRTGLPPSPSIFATIVSVVMQTALVAIWTAIQAALYVDLRDWKAGPAGGRLADVFA